MRDGLEKLLEMRDEAEKLARKYRYDPLIGPAHQKYLDTIYEIIDSFYSDYKFKNALRGWF